MNTIASRPQRRIRSTGGAAAVFVIGMLALQGGCTEGASTPPALSMRDSAGVRIVESRAPVWRTGEEWTIAPEPEVVIGVVEGEVPYLLSSVRDAARLSDGRIVVANGGSSELRIFDATGRYLRALGGEGRSPGEFENLNSLHLLPGDSLAAWDGILHRLTIFTEDGRVGREWTVDALAVLMPPILGIFNDGTLLSVTSGGRARTDAAQEEYRDSLLWVRVRPGTTRMDVIGDGLGTENLIIAEANSAQNYQILFGRTSLVTGTGDRWFSADNGRYEIRVASPTGELAALLRRIVEPRPATPEILASAREEVTRQQLRSEAAIRSFTEQQGGTYTGQRMAADEIPHRTTLPFFEKLLVDEVGNLWVRDYRPTGEFRQLWSVFDRTGRWLGEVETPEAIDVFRVGDDYLLGRAKDAMEVESVHLYRLSKPPVETISP